MADLKRNGLNNQRRSMVAGVFPLTEAEILATPIVATLPDRVLVTNVQAIVTTVSTTATATIDVKVGATVVANEIAVTTAGVAGGTLAESYFATGGDITVVAGAVAPAAGDLVVEVVVEYLELDSVNGSYTES